MAHKSVTLPFSLITEYLGNRQAPRSSQLVSNRMTGEKYLLIAYCLPVWQNIWQISPSQRHARVIKQIKEISACFAVHAAVCGLMTPYGIRNVPPRPWEAGWRGCNRKKNIHPCDEEVTRRGDTRQQCSWPWRLSLFSLSRARSRGRHSLRPRSLISSKRPRTAPHWRSRWRSRVSTPILSVEGKNR